MNQGIGHRTQDRTVAVAHSQIIDLLRIFVFRTIERRSEGYPKASGSIASQSDDLGVFGDDTWGFSLGCQGGFRIFRENMVAEFVLLTIDCQNIKNTGKFKKYTSNQRH